MKNRGGYTVFYYGGGELMFGVMVRNCQTNILARQGAMLVIFLVRRSISRKEQSVPLDQAEVEAE